MRNKFKYIYSYNYCTILFSLAQLEDEAYFINPNEKKHNI